MLKILATFLIGGAVVVSNTFTTYDSWLARFIDNFRFGAISFPTSLDNFTNPGATDSVLTVSHSGQHSNANDAIEALEAKLGITGSTAVANSFLVGNGSGSSIWSTYATGTNITATGQGLFGSLISQASSTIIGGLTITGNSTTTNATSTIGAFTNLATSTKYYGAGLTPCSGGNFVTWTDGIFGCSTPSALGGNTSYIASSSILSSDDTNYGNATTTYFSINEKVVIFAHCRNNAALTWTLNVKQPGIATSTIDVDKNASNGPAGLFGIYQAPTSAAAEIYVGDGSLAYTGVCRSPNIMYLKFVP